jgi:hypothetical protein
MAAYYHPSLCRFEAEYLVYSGGYSVYLLGDSSKYRGIIIVSGILHNYHTDKLVTGINHLITYLGQGILFSSHSVSGGLRLEWCNLEHYIVLSGVSSKCRGFIIVNSILHHYCTHKKLVIGNKLYVTYLRILVYPVGYSIFYCTLRRQF